MSKTTISAREKAADAIVAMRCNPSSDNATAIVDSIIEAARNDDRFDDIFAALDERPTEKEAHGIVNEAIAKHRSEEHLPGRMRRNAEPEHHDGEPCTLPVSPSSKEAALGLRFEYWEKRNHYSAGEWTNGGNDVAIYKTKMPGSVTVNTCWILRAVPIEPPRPELGRYEYQWSQIYSCKT